MRDFLKKNKWTLVVTSLIILLPVAVGLLLWVSDLKGESDNA